LALGVSAGPDAIVITEVFSKKTQSTPKHVIEACQRRLRAYDAATDGEED
jgi:phage-related protein